MKPDWSAMFAMLLLVIAAVMIPAERTDLGQMLVGTAVVFAVLSLKK